MGDLERLRTELIFSELLGSMRIQEEKNSNTSFKSFIQSLLLLAVCLQVDCEINKVASSHVVHSANHASPDIWDSKLHETLLVYFSPLSGWCQPRILLSPEDMHAVSSAWLATRLLGNTDSGAWPC